MIVVPSALYSGELKHMPEADTEFDRGGSGE